MTTMAIPIRPEFCGQCAQAINNLLKSMTCVICNKKFHNGCCELTEHCVKTEVWYCSNCIVNAFAFNHIENDEAFLESIASCTLSFESSNAVDVSSANELELNLFPVDFRSRSLLNNDDIDPDLNYFNDIAYSSTYLTPYALEQKMSMPAASFAIMHINCRSMLGKLSDIRELLHGLPVSILALWETWLGADSEKLVNIPGYQFLHKPREGGHGGVGLLIKDDISFERCISLESRLNHQSYEGIFIKIPFSRETLTLGTIYRPPGQNLTDFNNDFENLLSQISGKNRKVALVGDFNINLLKTEVHKASDDFYNCVISHHFLPAITKPTRITSHSLTLIDNLFTNAWLNIIDSSIVVSDISDHLPIMIRFDFESPKRGKPNLSDSRNFTEDNKNKFRESLSVIDWSSVTAACNDGNVNKAYDHFMTIYKKAYDKSFPPNRKAEISHRYHYKKEEIHFHTYQCRE